MLRCGLSLFAASLGTLLLIAPTALAAGPPSIDETFATDVSATSADLADHFSQSAPVTSLAPASGRPRLLRRVRAAAGSRPHFAERIVASATNLAAANATREGEGLDSARPSFQVTTTFNHHA